MPEPDTKTDPFIEAVAVGIDRHGLLAPGEAVVVGVSGGPDSVALLSALMGLSAREGRGYKLTVAHLNHRLREEAAADEDFVAALAGKWNLPYITGSADVKAEAAKAGGGIEEAARRLRYDFLIGACAQAGAAVLAVGHHGDDQVETVLYRILRGTSLHGLRGMQAAREIPGGIRLIRPLLELRRTDIEAYLSREGLSWREDASNLDLSYKRNFIRHSLLPLLKERINQRCDEALLRLADSAGEAGDYFCRQAQPLIEAATRPVPDGTDTIAAMDAPSLACLDPILCRWTMKMFLEQNGLPLRAVTAEHIKKIAELVFSCGGVVQLPGGYKVSFDKGLILLAVPPSFKPAPAWTEEVALACPGKTSLPDGRSVVCSFTPFDSAAFESHCRARKEGMELLDAQAVSMPLTCRTRREGDWLRPLGAPGRQKVGDMLINLKIPPYRREQVLCIRDQAGIIYACPLRIDQRVRVTAASRHLLRIAVLPAEDQTGD